MEPRNERNIEALMSAIAESVERMDYMATFPEDLRQPRGTDIERLAEHLARRGVLVPSALRADQVSGIFDVPISEGFREVRVRLLEQVAKGEYLTADERVTKEGTR